MKFKVGDRVRTYTIDRFTNKLGTVGGINLSAVSRTYEIKLDCDGRGSRMFAEWELLPVVSSLVLSDGSDRVVFEVTPEPTYQIVFSDKPLLELTRAEARQVFRQLEALI